MYGFRALNKHHFVPRVKELKELEARQYDGFSLSCKHRDILRCSTSKHFRSCYSKNGMNKHVPYELCENKNVAIIGKKDKSGDFIWRAFVKLNYFAKELTIYRIYGNNAPDIESIREQLPIPTVYTFFDLS